MKKLNITAKNVICELAKVSVFLFFMPICYVSLFSINVQISLKDIMMGTISGTSNLFDGSPLVFIAVLLPIVVLVVSLFETIKSKVKGIVTSVTGLIEIVILIIVKTKVAEIVEDNWLTSNGSLWYFLFVAVSVVLLVLGVLIYLNILSWDGNVNSMNVPPELRRNVGEGLSKIGSAVGTGINKIGDKISKTSIPADKIVGYCQKCGSPYEVNTKFCTQCGNPIVTMQPLAVESETNETHD